MPSKCARLLDDPAPATDSAALDFVYRSLVTALYNRKLIVLLSSFNHGLTGYPFKAGRTTQKNLSALSVSQTFLAYKLIALNVVLNFVVPKRLFLMQNNEFSRKALNNTLLLKLIQEPRYCNSRSSNSFRNFLMS